MQNDCSGNDGSPGLLDSVDPLVALSFRLCSQVILSVALLPVVNCKAVLLERQNKSEITRSLSLHAINGSNQ